MLECLEVKVSGSACADDARCIQSFYAAISEAVSIPDQRPSQAEAIPGRIVLNLGGNDIVQRGRASAD